MNSGLSYKHEFETACKSLALESDGEQVRRTMIAVEWVLAGAINGVFLLSAMVQTAVIMISLGWLFNINSMDWQVKAIFFAIGVAMLLSIYWISKFVLWHEISRHLTPRRFGDLLLN
jgi:hypothetical protein